MAKRYHRRGETVLYNIKLFRSRMPRRGQVPSGRYVLCATTCKPLIHCEVAASGSPHLL